MNMVTSSRYFASAIAVLIAVFSCRTVSGVTLTMLPIDDAGNAVDSRLGVNLGAVPYTYYLDKYDVTNAQYAEFLNAKAVNADPYGLYAPIDMPVNPNGGITRSANAPFVYTVKPGMANKPVVFVSWYDALRFTNWLTNGQGDGDTESGSYLITAGSLDGGNVTVPSAAQRAAWSTSSKHYLLPNTNEWHKAAFYKSGGPNVGYWNYPFGSNNPPTSGPPGTFHGANIVGPTGPVYPNDLSVHLTDVGAYNYPGPYGQMDMGGNVGKFTDTFRTARPDLIDWRGGGWNFPAVDYQDGGGLTPSASNSFIGFRVAMVPEPCSVTLAVLAAAGLIVWRFSIRAPK